MSHKPVTHSDPISMPRHPYLLVRDSRFYFNMRVPKDLRHFYPDREVFRKTLGTTDSKEAKNLVSFETFRQLAEFEEKRRKMKATDSPSVARTISDKDAYDLVFRWFIDLERQSEAWWESEHGKFEKTDVDDTLHNPQIDEAVFSGGSKNYRAEDASGELDSFLKTEGLEFPKDSLAYRKLVSLFTKGRLENIHRSMARVVKQPIAPREHLFFDKFAHTPQAPARQSLTVGKMIERYLKCLTDEGRSEKTLLTYKIPYRLLREELGEETLVVNITRERMEQLYSLLRHAPSNVTKRYPGLTLNQAVELANRMKDEKRLASKSLENYRVNIEAIFNFAVDEGFIDKNPARGRTLRASLEGGTPPKKKVPFTVDEMNRLFQVAPFALDKKQGGGRLKTGRRIMNSGRAWATLLAVFHGFRLNEVTQLYVEDVKEQVGIPFIEIRKEREDGSKSDKKLKTAQSKRCIPLHPELLKMGFLTFVEQRKKDALSPRLFPDLPRGATGYYSDPFSKWFSGFVDNTLGKQCKATFHSFRHQFRDALREAGVPTEDREALGGWKLVKHSAEGSYGHGPSLKYLRKQIQKVKFPRLDLAHLYINTP